MSHKSRKRSLRHALWVSLALHGIFILTIGTLDFGKTPRTSSISMLVEIANHHPDKATNTRRVPSHPKNAKNQTKTIETIEKSDSQKSPELPQASEPVIDSSPGNPQSALQAYIADFSQMLDRKKFYPRNALLREEEGKVIVALSILTDGTIVELTVEEPSPYDSLNRAALQAVRDLPPLEPLPFGAPSRVHVHIPLEYKLSR